MSLEKKIQSMLAERATLPISNMDNGDKKPIPAGSSQNAEYSELSKDIKGDEAAAPVAPAEAQANLGLKGDPTKVTTQAQRDALESFTTEDLDMVLEYVQDLEEKLAVFSRDSNGDMKRQMDSNKDTDIGKARRSEAAGKIKARRAEVRKAGTNGPGRHSLGNSSDFSVETKYKSPKLESADIEKLFVGVELQEGFIEKATGLFEAVVVARVNEELDTAVASLKEQTEVELKVTKAKLAEDVDAYLSYVVESWMKDNQLSVDAGLRTEVAESFIAGLKDLFTENFIEVPEDKVQVVEALSTDLESTKSRLNEEIEKSIALSDKIVKLEKSAVIAEASKSLTVTDAERLSRLVEGVEFDNQEVFAEKVALIKEAHFKAQPKKSAETILAEQAGQGNETKEVSAQVSRYVSALNRNSKF